MRRSRSGLVLFFCTFLGSLMGVGFADGGHQSVGKPADQYRLDLDEPADDWCGLGKLSYAPEPVQQPARDNVSASGAVGASGWIALPLPGSWPIAVLYVDDETACQISSAHEAAADAQVARAYAGCDAAPAATVATDWANEADFVDWSQFSAESFGQLACTLDPSERCFDEYAVPAVPAQPLSDAELLLEASASGGWMAILLVREQLTAEAGLREYAWEGCQGYPDASMAGWLDESAAIADAQLWRSIGSMARQIVEQLAAERDRLITAATRQLADMLDWPAATESTAETSPADDDLRQWLNVSRSPGAILAL